MASKPDRLVKDLDSARQLATVLEEEAESLRKMKLSSQPEANGNTAEANGNGEQVDSTIANMDDSVEDEPRERGSDAVERRVEKIMADVIDQGLVDTSDEKAVEAKRVSSSVFCPHVSGS